MKNQNLFDVDKLLLRKRGRTSNILIMTGGKGIPIAHGGIISGNHNDLYEIVPQYGQMIKHLNRCGIFVKKTVSKMQIKALILKSLEELFIRKKCLLTL